MKIAITGKGGVGKTLLSGLLSKAFAQHGYSVIAIDADPDADLAATLGFPNPDKIVPLSKMSALVAERTGSASGNPASFFKLNPRVDDIPEKHSIEHDGIKLMVMGRMKKGGSGCYCSENAMLQTLVTHLLLASNEVVIMDMEAGIEHLGRATAKAVDKLIVVVEPGSRSLETARKIRQLAKDIGLEAIAVVGNKISNETEKEFVVSRLPDFEFIGFIPYDEAIVRAQLANQPLLESSQPIVTAVSDIYHRLITGAGTD